MVRSVLEKVGIAADEQQHRRPQHRIPQILQAFVPTKRHIIPVVPREIGYLVRDFYTQHDQPRNATSPALPEDGHRNKVE